MKTQKLTRLNYTQGPWYATGWHVQSAAINVDNYVCRAEGDDDQQAEDNAKLIAAAPDLLAELMRVEIELMGWLESEDIPEYMASDMSARLQSIMPKLKPLKGY